MAECLDATSQVPVGAHCLSLHATQEEAADHAAAFLSGSPPEHATSYWVAQAGLVPLYRERIGAVDPRHVRSIRVLAGPQVHRVDHRLRPVEEITSFFERHPEGATCGADTITWYWTPDDIRDHLEYEQWFQLQPRVRNRFLCPYDLRRIPLDDAVPVLRELADHHSHLVFSRDRQNPIRLLQLMIFVNTDDIPTTMSSDLDWAVDAGYATVGDETGSLSPTLTGRDLLESWGRD
jgi:hypothetical protein